MHISRNLAFYIIILAWLLFLGIICAILISLLPFGVENAITFLTLLALLAAYIFFYIAKRIYVNLSLEDRRFVQQGAVITTISALVGNLVFLIIDNAQLAAAIGAEWLSGAPSFILLEVLVTCGITAIPAFVCGGALAFELLRDLTNNTYSKKSALFKGAVLGMTLGISLSIGVGILVGVHQDFEIWLWRSIIVTALAGFSGIWTGWRLGKLIPQTRTA